MESHPGATSDDSAAHQALTRSRRRAAPIAAFWSFLFPGAGQLYNHQPRLALVFALPVVLLLVGMLAAVLLLGGDLMPRLLDRRVILGLLVADAVVLLWRLVSMLQAHGRRASFRIGRAGTHMTAALVVIALVMHAAPALYATKLLETLSAVSLEGGAGMPSGIRDRFPGLMGEPGALPPAPRQRPDPREEERTNVLLLGIDSAVGRDHALTDTMLVVSLHPDGSTSMLSIPRDLVNAPLPNGGTYPRKLNSLLQTASADPAAYPYGGGAATLKATIGELLGRPIHYFAAVDLAGFEHVVNAVGGVTVSVESPITDPTSGLFLQPGPLHMDGELALRYVRSRYGVGNNDFVRAGRQQQVVAAIRDELAAANLMTALPGLLDAVRDTIATDVPADHIPDLAAAIQRVDIASLRRAVLEPPEYVTPATGDGGAYVLLPDLANIRLLAQQLMGD